MCAKYIYIYTRSIYYDAGPRALNCCVPVYLCFRRRVVGFLCAPPKSREYEGTNLVANMCVPVFACSHCGWYFHPSTCSSVAVSVAVPHPPGERYVLWPHTIDTRQKYTSYIVIAVRGFIYPCDAKVTELDSRCIHKPAH